jgi:hypothetical protein
MHRFNSIALAVTLAVAGGPAASAGTVTVETQGINVTVEIKEASVAEVLTKLSQTQNFQVERIGTVDDNLKLNRTITGPLSVVLARVLERNSSVVVTAPRTRKVERVVLYGERQAATATPAAPAASPAQVSKPGAAKAVETKPAGEPELDPHVKAALERAAKDAEVAKANPDASAVQASDVRPPRRAAAGYLTGTRGRRS